jgi:DNA-binding XRE family transcriptional regulator
MYLTDPTCGEECLTGTTPSVINSEWHRRLRKAVDGKGKRAQLARAIGCSRPTISALVKGEYDPTARTALKLKRHLGIPIEALEWGPRKTSS